MDRNLLGKIVISGTLECLTGLHIGASKENMEIGAIDSPVVRDPATREPYIPGSSLKGKMRALLEKALSITKRRDIGTPNNPVRIHVCDDADDALKCEVCRVFGSTGRDGRKNFPARLMIRDLYLTRDSVSKLSDIDTGLQYTEWKFENAIDRVTSAANPRQIERVPRGAEFEFELIYNVEDNNHLETDLKNIKLALDLLELDSLGGHGSRGYGKVKINDLETKAITIDDLKTKSDGNPHEVSLEQIEEIKKLFAAAKNGSHHESLSV